MKLCKDCISYVRKDYGSQALHECHNKKNVEINPVHGYVSFRHGCTRLRADYSVGSTFCGPVGNWWEPIDNANQPDH